MLRDVIKKKWTDANVENGYVRKLETNEADDCPSCYLPHFPVIREDRETTKVCIVLDSAANCKGISLNDAMLIGRKLQRSVLEILLRFLTETRASRKCFVRLSSLRKTTNITDCYGEISIPQGFWMSMKQSVLTFGNRASRYVARFVLCSHTLDFKENHVPSSSYGPASRYEDLPKVLGGVGFRAQKWWSNRTL